MIIVLVIFEQLTAAASGGCTAAASTAVTNVAIVSFRPPVSLSYSATTMSVVVDKRIAESERLLVHAAGRECADPMVADDRKTISCTVPGGVGYGAVEGPVRVTYASSNRTFSSTGNCSFVVPVVNDVSPDVGPVRGGTRLNIGGKFLKLARDVLVVVDPGIPCAIVRRENDFISCTTTAFRKPAKRSHVECQVRVRFDGALESVANNPFKYVAEPTITERQLFFQGIASGGTRFPVKGSFSRHDIERPRVYVESDGERHYGDCLVTDEEHMICRAPNVAFIQTAVPLPTVLPLGFEMDFFGQKLDRSLHSMNYRVYPDPFYGGFEVDGNVVRINGLFLYTDYRPDELTVRLRSSSDACNVTAVDEMFIECRASSSAEDVVEITVSVAGTLNNTVVKARTVDNGPVIQSTVLSTAAMVFVFITLVLGLLFILKTILFNSKQQTEKRFVEELRNITAGIDN